MSDEIFKIRAYNPETNEYIAQKSRRSIRNVKKEVYYMKYKIKDVTWMKQLAIVDLMIYETLVNEMDADNMVVTTTLLKKQIMYNLNIAHNVYYTSIKKLHDKDMLVKLTMTDMMINPKYYFKGTMAESKKLALLYEDYKQQVKL